MVLPTVSEWPKFGTYGEVPTPQDQPEGSCRDLPGAKETPPGLTSSSQRLQQETEVWQPEVSSANHMLNPGTGCIATDWWPGGTGGPDQPLPAPPDTSSPGLGRTQGLRGIQSSCGCTGPTATISHSGHSSLQCGGPVVSGAWLFVSPKELSEHAHTRGSAAWWGRTAPTRWQHGPLLLCSIQGLPALTGLSACPHRSCKMGWPQW